MHRLLAVSLAAALPLAACSSKSSSQGATAPPLVLTVNASVAPRAPSVVGADGVDHPLASMRDGKGLQTDFGEDELVILPASDAELQAFLARWGGTVIQDSKDLPTSAPGESPPPGVPTPPRRVRVRVSAPLSDLSTVAADAAAVGMGGPLAVGTQAGARLLATALREGATGHKVVPNFFAAGDAWLRGTQEELVGSSYDDAFSYKPFNGELPGVHDRSTVVGAWQYLSAVGYTPRSIRLAVIDGGFWLDASGHPYDQGPGTDLPASPLQYSIHDGSPYAGGMNPTSCTGGTPCPWHGNGSAGVATGLIDNQKGAAGTGGLVAEPILLKIDGSDLEVVGAIYTALDFGARVLSMSFGGSCNGFCQAWRSVEGFYDAFAAAAAVKVPVVAAAGNDATDATAANFEPCTVTGVICVGALASYDDTAIGYSNYGSSITIWAPTDIPVMPNGSDPTKLADHNGTSASTPFVAGVVAMMLAVNGALAPADVIQILRGTAWSGAFASPDPKVSPAGYLDAKLAVMTAGHFLPADSFEPDDTPQTAAVLPGGSYTGLTLHRVGDLDYYLLDMPDYGWMEVIIQNMPEGFGAVNEALSPVSAALAPLWANESNDPVAGHKLVYGVVPGTYLLGLSGAIQPYALTFTPHALGIQADQFEPDETPSTAATVLPGEYFATFHTVDDQDWYAFVVNVPSSTSWYSFWITDSEVPLTLDLYDANQVHLGSSSGASPTFTFEQPDDGKTFYVHVRNPGRTAVYDFAAQTQRKPSNVPPFISSAVVPVLDPSDPSPFSHVLRDTEGWLAFTAPVSAVGAVTPTQLDTTSAAVHLALQDGTGSVLGEGTAVVDAASGQRGGEVLAFGGLVVAGQDYFVHVTRLVPWMTPTDGTGALPPPVEFDTAMH